MQTSRRRRSPCAPARSAPTRWSKIERGARGKVGGEVTKERDELIGPSLGEELRRNALIALSSRWPRSCSTWRSGSGGRSARRRCWRWSHDVVDRGRRVRLAGQADRRGLPGGDAHRHRLLGQRQGRGLRPHPRTVAARPQGRRSPRWRTRAILQTVPRTVNTGLGALFILAALAAARRRLADGLRGGPADRHHRRHALLVVAGAVPLAIELEKRSSTPPPQPKRRGRSPPPRGRAPCSDRAEARGGPALHEPVESPSRNPSGEGGRQGGRVRKQECSST